MNSSMVTSVALLIVVGFFLILVFDFFYFLLYFRIVLISSRRSFCSIFSVLPYRDCTQVGYVYLYVYYIVFLGLHVDLITDNSMMKAIAFTYLL